MMRVALNFTIERMGWITRYMETILSIAVLNVAFHPIENRHPVRAPLPRALPFQSHEMLSSD
jgi:hypothetical protein